MKIAILRRSPGISYSMDVYADALMCGLKTVRPEWEIVDLFPYNPSQGERTNSLSKGLRKYYQRYWRYPQQLRHYPADIFHIIDHSDGYLVTRLKKDSTTVVTCHDLINLVRPELFQDMARFPQLSMAMWKRSLKAMCKANRVITVSRHTAQDAIQHLPLKPEQIETVPDGVESIYRPLEAQTAAKFRLTLGIPSQSCCLLNVGSNHPRKNIITILKVVDYLHRKGLPIHFCKAGDDFSGEQKKYISDRQLSACITYVGKPDKATLVKIYNAADLLVAPSTYEGFGITVLEAMACGLPVIAANVTSLPEVTGDAAILVDPLDVTAICKWIERILAEPRISQELKTKGLQRAKQFTWQAVAEQVAQIYESLTNVTLSC